MIIGGTYEDLLAFINSKSHFVLDIETDGLNPRTGHIMGIGIASGGRGFYIACNYWDNGSGQLRAAETASQAAQCLQLLKGKRIICHNAAFDLPFIKHQTGIDLIADLYIDTMLLKHTVDEEFPFGLKEIAARIWGDKVLDEQKDMLDSIKANGGGAKEYFKADAALLGKYCVQDCLLTEKVMEYYLPQLVKQNLTDFYFKDEVMPLYKEVTIPMEQHGIRLNMPLLITAQKEIQEDIDALETKILAQIEPHLELFKQWFLNKDYPPARSGAFAQGIAEYASLPLPKTKTGAYSLTEKAIAALPESLFKSVLQQKAYLATSDVRAIQELLWSKTGGKHMFNLLSKHHLKKLFFDTLKEKPLSTTDKGNPQVDDEFLQLMAKKYEWCHDLHTYNRLTKIKGTYIERFLEEQENGRFYPRFMQHRTISGRYGSDLQQLPRPLEAGQDENIILKHNNRIREFFIADEGCTLVDDDYESLEPHIFSHVSGDPGLQNIFKEGLDFYSLIAIRTEKLNQYSADKKASNYLGKVNKAKRQTAKSYSLGVPYGMTGYKLAFEINVSQDEAEVLVQNYLDSFPGLKAWMQNTQKQVLEQGFVRIETGRIRHMPEAPLLYRKHGPCILNDLDLWKQYHDMPSLYARAKEDRKRLKNYVNNGNNVQIQGLAASIVNRACIAINRVLKSAGIPALVVAQIHDEIVVQCPLEQVDEVKQIVQNIMENNYKLPVPLKAPPSHGQNFKEAKG